MLSSKSLEKCGFFVFNYIKNLAFTEYEIKTTAVRIILVYLYVKVTLMIRDLTYHSHFGP